MWLHKWFSFVGRAVTFWRCGVIFNYLYRVFYGEYPPFISSYYIFKLKSVLLTLQTVRYAKNFLIWVVKKEIYTRNISNQLLYILTILEAR